MEFIEISAKNVDDAITQATVQLGITSDQLEYEVLDKGSTGFLGIGSKNAVIKARKKFSIDENVVEFLSSIFDAMKMEVEILVAVNEEEHIIEVELKGDDMGILIGKREIPLDWEETDCPEVWGDEEEEVEYNWYEEAGPVAKGNDQLYHAYIPMS